MFLAASLAAPAGDRDLDRAIATVRGVGPNASGASAAARAWKRIAVRRRRRAARGARRHGRRLAAGAQLAAVRDRPDPGTGPARQEAAPGHGPGSVPPRPAARPGGPPVRLRPDRESRAGRGRPAAARHDRRSRAATLRRDAVARVVADAEKLAKDKKSAEAEKEYRRALTAARDFDQLNAIVKAIGELGQKVSLSDHVGFLKSWKIVGPFPNPKARESTSFIRRSRKLDFAPNMTAAAGKVKWKDYKPSKDTGVIDLKEASATIGSGGVRADRIPVQDARDAEIRLGSFVGFKLWVNGELVLVRGDAYTGYRPDHYVAQVKLKPGVNTILVKFAQEPPPPQLPPPNHWRFMLRVCDPSGAAIQAGDNLVRRIAARSWAMSATADLRVVFAVAAVAADWRQFRGPAGDGAADGPAPPTQLSPDKATWTADLPGRGLSCPIVVGDRIFVTASSGRLNDRLHVLAVAAGDGKIRLGADRLRHRPDRLAPEDLHGRPDAGQRRPAGRRPVRHRRSGLPRPRRQPALGPLPLRGNPRGDRRPRAWRRRRSSSTTRSSSTSKRRTSPSRPASTSTPGPTAGGPNGRGASPGRRRRSCPAGRPNGGALVLLQGGTKLSAVEPATGTGSVVIWNVRTTRSRRPCAGATSVRVPAKTGWRPIASSRRGRRSSFGSRRSSIRSRPARSLIGNRIYCPRGSVLVVGDIANGAEVGRFGLRGGAVSGSPVTAGGLILLPRRRRHQSTCSSPATRTRRSSAPERSASRYWRRRPSPTGRSICAATSIFGSSRK